MSDIDIAVVDSPEVLDLKRPISCPLRSPSDGRHGGECLPSSKQDQAQQEPSARRHAAEIVADGGEDDVGSITVAAFEVTAAAFAPSSIVTPWPSRTARSG